MLTFQKKKPSPVKLNAQCYSIRSSKFYKINKTMLRFQEKQTALVKLNAEYFQYRANKSRFNDMFSFYVSGNYNINLHTF